MQNRKNTSHHVISSVPFSPHNHTSHTNDTLLYVTHRIHNNTYVYEKTSSYWQIMGVLWFISYLRQLLLLLCVSAVSPSRKLFTTSLSPPCRKGIVPFFKIKPKKELFRKIETRFRHAGRVLVHFLPSPRVLISNS